MSNKEEYSIYRSLQAAFLIIIMHVLLIGAIGALIFLFYGIVNHMALVITGIICFVIGVILIYKKIKADSKTIKKMAGESFKGKSIEVSFLGGVANIKITDSMPNSSVSLSSPDIAGRLEAPKADSAMSIAELARLYEKELITEEEFKKAKENIFKQNLN